MKKILFTLLLLIILLLGFGVYVVDQKSRSYLSHFLSQELNTPVTLKKTSLGFRTFILEGLSIEDPSASGHSILTIDRLTLHYKVLSLFKGPITIDELVIEHPFLSVRLHNANGSDNNWSQFFKGMNTGGYSEKSPEKFLINQVTIYNLGADLQSSLLGPYTAPLPERKKIVINNLNSNQIQSLKNQLTIIFEALIQIINHYPGLSAVSSGNTSTLLQNITNEINNQKEELAEKTVEPAQDSWDQFHQDFAEGKEKVKNFFNDLKKSLK